MPKKRSKLPAKLVKYLDSAGIDYEVLEHKTVYTAIDAANTMKRKLKEIAKALYVKADRDYWVVVLPADQNLDFNKLSKCLAVSSGKPVKTIKIPGEKIMQTALNIKDGAVSAFGNMYKVPVVMEKSLARAKKAVFSSGSFNHSIEMAARDFAKLEKAAVGAFGKKKKIKIQKITKPKAKKAVKKPGKPVKKKKTVKKIK
jgi:Ala-tRNA(Pro) deacylase